jgi:hypothetical protein
MDILNLVHALAVLHVAAEIFFTRKKRAQIGYRLLAGRLPSADLDDGFATWQAGGALLKKLMNMGAHEG